VDNSNFGILYEHLNATAFLAHPYNWPVIGWASDIEAWTIDDLKRHFRMGYAPNNCVLVMAGNVTEAEVMRLAKKYLEPIPKQEPPPPVRTKEPPQMGERRVTVRKAAQTPLLMVAYHVPEAAHADHRPLEMLATILTQGRSSRLYRRLVDRDQLTLSISAGKYDTLDPSLFRLTAQVRPGVEPGAVEKAVYEEVERLQRDGVTATELTKARNQMLVDFYGDLKTIAGKANLIGNYEILYGGHHRVNKVAEELEQVTAEDIQRVAKTYLTGKNRTVGTLIPETGEAAQ
jgi:zinc protease